MNELYPLGLAPKWVAEQLDRNSIGIELNPEYCDIIRRRMAGLEVNLFLAK